MGILNIDEHVEEHRLMAIRYPSKAVIPGTNVVAVSNIPFLIMPGDGAANGCQFTGTNGAFTLSAAILSNIGASLAGCYAYFSANFGGSSLPAGWYWTEFSSDTAGIVYAENYTSGKVSRPATKTAITPNLSGWVTATTNEVVGPTGFVLPGGALGKNGNLFTTLRHTGSVTGNKTYRLRAGDASTTQLMLTGTSTSPMAQGQYMVQCVDSHTVKHIGRTSTTGLTALGAASATMATSHVVTTCDTSVDQTLNFTLTQSSNVGGIVLLDAMIVATYGE